MVKKAAKPKPKYKPAFFIEQVITQGRTLYFSYNTPKGEFIGPAHEHTDQVDAIKEWINRTVAEKGLTAFDYLAHEYIKKVLEMSLEDWVAREESRNETEESSEDK